MTTPSDSPTSRLRTALRGHGDEGERVDAINAVRQRLAEEEAEIAFTMRLRGDAWEDIAQAFGVTRQAAHKRFAGADLHRRLAEARTLA